jgi:aryl-alcohol dehydrogenase-like predicted oxidoreductase
LGGADAYEPHHLDLVLDQLKTDRIDCLVVHGVADPDKQAKQQELAVTWQEKGLVKALGVWAPGPEPEKRYGPDNPYSFMVQPYNVGTPDAAASFMAARKLGWQTYACSPFIRGWRLDSMVQRAIEDGDSGSEEEIRSRLADQMLRYSLFRPNVDKLIVAIRRIEWVAANAASVARGPLSAEEESSLLALADSVK